MKESTYPAPEKSTEFISEKTTEIGEESIKSTDSTTEKSSKRFSEAKPRKQMSKLNPQVKNLHLDPRIIMKSHLPHMHPKKLLRSP